MKRDQQLFIELIKDGLWKSRSTDDSRVTIDESVDWNKLYQLAEEQSVVGLVATGINRVQKVASIGARNQSSEQKFKSLRGEEFKGTTKVPKTISLKFVGRTMQLEHHNEEMNHFISELVDKLREKGIETLLVKGQGLAQCYEQPLSRASGDVDLLLDEENYKKAKDYLLPLATKHKREERYSKHLGIDIDPWYVEIHGTLRTGLSERVDKMVDAVQEDIFRNGRVRIWMNNNTRVLLPAPNHDTFMVFTHFIKHFYKKGMVLRQICDWVRLLWTYRGEIDAPLLKSWINRAGLMNEWQAFASLAVDQLGMPAEAMPFYDSRCRDKGERLLAFILEGYSGKILRDTLRIAKLFPWKALCYSPSIFWTVNWLKVKERMTLIND